MNESDRKFFLKNFFSFNVSSSVNSGSSNVSFNNDTNDLGGEEQAEIELVTNSSSPDNNNNSKIKIKSINEMKKGSLDESLKLIDVASSTSTSLPYNHQETIEKSTTENEQRVNTESSASSRAHKQLKRQGKKLSQNHVETVEFSDLSNSNILLKQSPPIIQISNCREEEKINRTTSISNSNSLQQQHSIELKPFKKKEVQISDSLEIDHYTSDEKSFLNGSSTNTSNNNNNSLSANYDSLSNSFNNSIKSDISHLNTTTTTLTTLSSTEDVNKNEKNLTESKNDEDIFLKKSVELMSHQQPPTNLALFEKSMTDSQNLYVKQMSSFLNSPSASGRVSLTPKFISIRYRLE